MHSCISNNNKLFYNLANIPTTHAVAAEAADAEAAERLAGLDPDVDAAGAQAGPDGAHPAAEEAQQSTSRGIYCASYCCRSCVRNWHTMQNMHNQL